MITGQPTTWRGMQALHYQHDGHLLTIVSSLGGRLVSFSDPDGYEWLVQPSGDAIYRPVGSHFSSIPAYGWDELIPTITPCRYRGREVASHGDAWSATWDVDSDGMRFTDPAGRYALHRSVLRYTSGFLLRYRLTAAEPVEVLWAAHPLLRCPEQTSLLLPEGTDSIVRVDDGLQTVTSAQAVMLPAEMDRGSYRKYYLPTSDHASWVALRRPSGRTLRLDWGAAELPYLGLYAEDRCFTAEPCVAPEPSTSWYDSLDVAIVNGTALRVLPDTPQEWWVSISTAQNG